MYFKTEFSPTVKVSYCQGKENMILATIEDATKLSLQCFDTVGWATGRASGL